MAGVSTLVAPNPVTGGVAIGAKVAQAGLAIGQIAFAERPLVEAVEVGVTFLLGRAGGAAAGQAFRRAGASGLIDNALGAASAQLTPLINRGFNTAGQVFREVSDDLFDRGAMLTGPLITSTVQTSQELSSLLDQGGAFVRTATERGTNIAK